MFREYPTRGPNKKINPERLTTNHGYPIEQEIIYFPTVPSAIINYFLSVFSINIPCETFGRTALFFFSIDIQYQCSKPNINNPHQDSVSKYPRDYGCFLYLINILLLTPAVSTILMSVCNKYLLFIFYNILNSRILLLLLLSTAICCLLSSRLSFSKFILRFIGHE